MTRGRVRWVASQVLDHFTRAGGTATSTLLFASTALAVRQEEQEQAVRPVDVRHLGVVVNETRRLHATLGGPPHDVALDTVLDKAEAELAVLGTAAAMLSDGM